MEHGRGWIRQFAAVSVWVCGLGGALLAPAQGGVDGTIGGHVLSTVGAPVQGVTVVVSGSETGLMMRAVSGAAWRGFLVVRLPVGEYAVMLEDAGVRTGLPCRNRWRCGWEMLTEIEVRTPAPRSSARARRAVRAVRSPSRKAS